MVSLFYESLSFCLCWVFTAAWAFLWLQWASPRPGGCPCCGAQAPGQLGFRRCGLLGPRARAQYVWRTGLVAPWRLGSSPIRGRTCVPCIGKPILHHCATREAPLRGFLMVIKTLPLIGRRAPRGSSSCGFQDSLASCTVGLASPLLQMKKARLREVLKVLNHSPCSSHSLRGLFKFHHPIQTFKC